MASSPLEVLRKLASVNNPIVNDYNISPVWSAYVYLRIKQNRRPNDNGKPAWFNHPRSYTHVRNIHAYLQMKILNHSFEQYTVDFKRNLTITFV